MIERKGDDHASPDGKLCVFHGSRSLLRVLSVDVGASQVIERLYDIASDWDNYELERLYCAWAADKDPAHNEDARFLGGVKSYTKGKPAP